MVAKRLHQFPFELECRAGGNHLRRQITRRNVGNAVSKTIDVNYSRHDFAVTRSRRPQRLQTHNIRNRRPQLRGLDTQRQRRGHWRKDITTVECCADRMAPIFLASKLKQLWRDAENLARVTNVTKDPIVRADEKCLAGFDQYCAASGAYRRIHHSHMNRACGKRRARSQQREGSGLNVVRRNFVRDIDDAGLRIGG